MEASRVARFLVVGKVAVDSEEAESLEEWVLCLGAVSTGSTLRAHFHSASEKLGATWGRRKTSMQWLSCYTQRSYYGSTGCCFLIYPEYGRQAWARTRLNQFSRKFYMQVRKRDTQWVIANLVFWTESRLSDTCYEVAVQSDINCSSDLFNVDCIGSRGTTYIYVCIHMYIHIYIYIHEYKYIDIYVYLFMWFYLFIHIFFFYTYLYTYVLHATRIYWDRCINNSQGLEMQQACAIIYSRIIQYYCHANLARSLLHAVVFELNTRSIGLVEST